jgi:hypothetical protein
MDNWLFCPICRTKLTKTEGTEVCSYCGEKVNIDLLKQIINWVRSEWRPR